MKSCQLMERAGAKKRKAAVSMAPRPNQKIVKLGMKSSAITRTMPKTSQCQ